VGEASREEGVERLSVPGIPPQFRNQNDFGENGIRWGTGEAAALARINALTLDELQSINVTREMALEWAAFYVNEARRKPANGSARGRARLMAYAADLLGGG
jgi:hypothetical protein